jgi:hypothetical protein
MKCYIWIIGLYSAETWTDTSASSRKYLEMSEILCCRRMGKVLGPNVKEG